MKITFKELDRMGHDSVTDYCRVLVQEETFPETLEVYRGEMLCLTVDVKKAAKLMPTGRGFTNYDSTKRRRAIKGSLQPRGCVSRGYPLGG